MKYPTAENPLVLTYSGHIPSMKNEIVIDLNSSRPVRRSAKVVSFKRNAEQKITEQFQKSGFDLIPKPHKVGAFVCIYSMFGEDINGGDTDNMYTTLQETWQGIAIENDSQIQQLFSMQKLAVGRKYQYAYAVLWKIDILESDFLKVYARFATQSLVEALKR